MNEKIKEVLLELSDDVYLYTAKGNPLPPYIIYGIDGENNLLGGNSRSELCDTGYIDLFTKHANDELIKAIPNALENAGIAFYLNSVQHEDDTEFLHYEWRWEAA